MTPDLLAAAGVIATLRISSGLTPSPDRLRLLAEQCVPVIASSDVIHSLAPRRKVLEIYESAVVFIKAGGLFATFD